MHLKLANEYASLVNTIEGELNNSKAMVNLKDNELEDAKNKSSLKIA